jgi:ppGpp synthetase/RelA/SpoT-type nucleotidyltranferase
MMKIPSSVRNAYENLKSQYGRLQGTVDALFKDSDDIKPNWFYFSRLKELESYALKIESGKDPSTMEDFFACTLVVPKKADIYSAQVVVEKYCNLNHRRPEKDNSTSFDPQNFSFDDLRLYVIYNDERTKTDFSQLIFEVQIKTFFQHAWALAAHDLIYKSDDISWAKRRVAYQIKAMLEHAEVSIHQTEQLSKSDTVAKENEKINELKEIIQNIKDLWQPDQLPQDLIRLAENIQSICANLSIKYSSLFELVKQQTDQNRGAKIQSLSPYGAIMQCLLDDPPHRDSLQAFANRRAKQIKRKIFIPNEIELPQEFSAWKQDNFYQLDPNADKN